eukprot:COSAG06_NODE_30811_length_532_cov_0.588915_1_plen_166_part_01
MRAIEVKRELRDIRRTRTAEITERYRREKASKLANLHTQTASREVDVGQAAPLASDAQRSLPSHAQYDLSEDFLAAAPAPAPASIVAAPQTATKVEQRFDKGSFSGAASAAMHSADLPTDSTLQYGQGLHWAEESDTDPLAVESTISLIDHPNPTVRSAARRVQRS